MKLTVNRLEEFVAEIDKSSTDLGQNMQRLVDMINQEFQQQFDTTNGIKQLKAAIHDLNALLDARENSLYTVFCRQANGEGTIWIGVVDAASPAEALKAGIDDCAFAWSWESRRDEIVAIGLIKGDANVIEWNDDGC